MKFNKWTLGLAAVGVVSLTSAARADETNMVQTALSNTTISGYVDASAQFNPGGGGNNTPNYNFGNKANQISLNVVQISLDKPLDEAPWASGYHVDLWLGPDAASLGTSTSGGNAAIRQAYIALRTPVGNGIDWKIGVFDTIIGYEGLTSGNNPNFSRSYGFNIEPTTHTGVLAVYHATDWLTAQVGVADQSYGAGAYSAAINGIPKNGNNSALSTPTLMWGPTLTAPESWGWLKGGTLSVGTINTSGSAGATSYYAGVTVPTPIAKLKFGGSFDYLNVRADANGPGTSGGNTWNVAGYSTYAFNDKLSLNLRGEHLQGDSVLNGGAYNNTTAAGLATGNSNNAADEITATLQYNLWANVLTRVEIRWDHVEHGNGYASTSSTGVGTESEAWLIGAQAIYTF
ncbi:MAG TPA: outer membrane beta-barrel protein [Verrucomicrobiae bacterium]|nr:outer membrane beta-barrel protein [Verrucomicrobiae bacterium]